MTTPEQRNERLLQVCRVLRELPKEKRFSLFLFGWYQCGTAACAAGWAAVDPWFTRRGFKLGKDRIGYFPVYKSLDSFSAVRVFFGINCAHHLFGRNEDEQGARRDVIRRIEKFVRDNPA